MPAVIESLSLSPVSPASLPQKAATHHADPRPAPGPRPCRAAAAAELPATQQRQGPGCVPRTGRVRAVRARPPARPPPRRHGAGPLRPLPSADRLPLHLHEQRESPAAAAARPHLPHQRRRPPALRHLPEPCCSRCPGLPSLPLYHLQFVEEFNQLARAFGMPGTDLELAASDAPATRLLAVDVKVRAQGGVVPADPLRILAECLAMASCRSHLAAQSPDWCCLCPGWM